MSGDTRGVSDPGGTRHGAPRGWLQPAKSARKPPTVPVLPPMPEASVHTLPTTYMPAASYAGQSETWGMSETSGTSGTYGVRGLEELGHQLHQTQMAQRMAERRAGTQLGAQTGAVAARPIALTPRQWMERYGVRYPTLGQALRALPHRQLDWSDDDRTTAYEVRALVEAWFGALDQVDQVEDPHDASDDNSGNSGNSRT